MNQSHGGSVSFKRNLKRLDGSFGMQASGKVVPYYLARVLVCNQE
jgi:hypothetical protein